MNYRSIINLLFQLLLLLPITACATSLPIERRDYILTRPHGWVDLTIVDSAIPDLTIKEEKKTSLQKPVTCRVVVEVNSEVFLSEYVFPDGPAAPYSITSGFRFPVPVGEHNLAITYSGCRETGTAETMSIENALPVNVHDDMVYEINFVNDGFALAQEKPNEEVTLKKIYEALDQK